MSVGQLSNHIFALRGFATIIVKGPDGKIKRMETVPNLIRNAGLNWIASTWGGGAAGSAVRYMGICGTIDQAGAITGPAAADASCSSEPLWFTQTSENGTMGRMTASYAHVADAQNWTMSTSWSGGNSSASGYIYYVFLAACQSAGGIPEIAAASFAVVSKASQDCLTVAWTFCISNSV